MRTIYLALAAICILTSSCASLMEKMIEKPKIELDRVSVRDVNLTGSTLLFVVKVDNPNNIDIKVDELAYRVFVNGKPISNAKTDKTIVVPAKSHSEVEIPLPIEYTKIWSDLQDLVLAKTASYRLEGEAKLPLFSIPFSKEGKINVRSR